MMRILLVAMVAVALAAADHHEDHHDDHGDCCSAEDRREIQFLWRNVWSSSFTDRKVAIAKAVFDELFNRYPEAKDLLKRVKIDEPDSPEFRAHLVRVANGLDIVINLMDDPEVLQKQIEHLANQHAARAGVKAVYLKGMVEAFDHVLPQIAPCFNIEAWNRCFGSFMDAIAAKLP